MSETPEPTTGPDELDLLKGLLVEEEKREIADLRERVEQRRLEPGQVAEALPDAILLRGARDDRLGRALAPTIDDAIQESVKRDPSAIADAICSTVAARTSVTMLFSSTTSWTRSPPLAKSRPRPKKITPTKPQSSSSESRPPRAAQ